MDFPAGGPVLAGRYDVLRPLGSGSFGHTLLARDRDTGTEVAIKRLDTRAATDFKPVELFEREVAVLRALRHHAIPAVFDAFRDTWDGVPAAFFVMEYVPGPSLAQVIETQQPLAPADVMHLFLELLGVLEYLHARVPPILHRDLKPANIIVREGMQPALVDFGSVRRVFLGPDESGSTVAGTYGYMPYEQYMGQATPASDLYALGATFLHLVTGRPPRAFMTDAGALEVPDPLPGDARLGPVLRRLLRPSPAERYASARETRQALLAPDGATGAGRSLVPARLVAHAVALPPAPRVIEGETAALLDRVTPTAWQLMDTTSKPTDQTSIGDLLLFGFLSLLTVGVLPAVFFSLAAARRRRLRSFFEDGVPATAEVLRIALESTAFGEKAARVTYNYEADGATHRDVDVILPSVATRWQPGDSIQILYRAGADYDSVIISTS